MELPAALAWFVGSSRPAIVLQVDDQAARLPGPCQHAADPRKERLRFRHRVLPGHEGGLDIHDDQGLDGSRYHVAIVSLIAEPG